MKPYLDDDMRAILRRVHINMPLKVLPKYLEMVLQYRLNVELGFEAADLDGAGPWAKFRYLTLPLLLISVGPLLIGTYLAAYQKNNNLIPWFKDGKVIGRQGRLGLARELGVPMRMANLALEELTEAMNRGWGERDSRVAMLLQEERAGVKIAVPVEQLKEVLEKDGR